MSAQFDDGKDEGALRTIGEVSRALGIKTHILRYWEQQFPMLDPLKRSGGRRYYRPEDVGLVRTIHQLVNIEGYTLKGAQQAITSGKVQTGDAAVETLTEADRSKDGPPMADSTEPGARPAEAVLTAAAPFVPVAAEPADPADPGGLGSFFGRPVPEPVAEETSANAIAEQSLMAAEPEASDDAEAPPAGLSREEVIGHLRQLRARLVTALAS